MQQQQQPQPQPQPELQQPMLLDFDEDPGVDCEAELLGFAGQQDKR